MDKELESFLADLDKARENYRSADAKKQRTAALQQLFAAISWAERWPGVAERLEPLRHLFYAVGGIDTGFRDSMLRAPKVGHRGRLSIHEQSQRAIAAAAMDLTMQAGFAKDDAARRVVSALGAAQSFKAPTAKILAKWRETVMTASQAEDFGALRYRDTLQRCNGRSANELLEIADSLIATLTGRRKA
jgi:hypothetical protein